MMNTWTLPLPLQASSEGINAGFPIIVPVAFCASACPPWVQSPDDQPAELQTVLSGEEFR
jgi:hypothetical protein